MDRIRQFVNPESGKVVSCSWDEGHGAWVCQSERDTRFQCCSPGMTEMYGELREAGYEET